MWFKLLSVSVMSGLALAACSSDMGASMPDAMGPPPAVVCNTDADCAAM